MPPPPLASAPSCAYATDLRETRIHPRATAADSRKNRICRQEIAADNRETGICTQEIAAGRQEIASYIRETAADITANAADSRETADFAPELAQLAADYGAVTAKAAQAAADAKALAETALEDAAFVLARALAYHFKKTGDLDRHGKVDLTRNAIVKLRTRELVNKATAIRDLAAAAVNEPDAASRGVTPARVTALAAAIEAFRAVMNTPRGQIVNRGALLREVETDVAALLDRVSDLDDLVVQFDGEAGQRFPEAWRRARIIVDAGGGRADNPAPAPSPAPAPQ